LGKKKKINGCEWGEEGWVEGMEKGRRVRAREQLSFMEKVGGRYLVTQVEDVQKKKRKRKKSQLLFALLGTEQKALPKKKKGTDDRRWGVTGSNWGTKKRGFFINPKRGKKKKKAPDGGETTAEKSSHKHKKKRETDGEVKRGASKRIVEGSLGLRGKTMKNLVGELLIRDWSEERHGEGGF